MNNNAEMIIKEINNKEISLGEASSPIILAELKMRIIAELSKNVREALDIEIQNSPRRVNEKDYWNCRLEFLDKAIISVFDKDLSIEERKILENFRQPRNKLLHADFVALMNLLGIPPTSRLINPKDKSKKLLSYDTPVEDQIMVEAIKSVGRNQGLSTIRIRANEVNEILNKLIRLTTPKI